MNNIDFILSIISTISQPYGHSIEDDNIAEFLSKVAMRTIKDNNIEELQKIIEHERFSHSCHLRFFYDFFDSTNVKEIENLNEVFLLLLNRNYFDFSNIFYSTYKSRIRFYNNEKAFVSLIKHLSKNEIYFNQIVSNYEYCNFKIKNKEDLQIIQSYMDISKKYEILSGFINNGPEGISWCYGSVEEAFDEMKNSRYSIGSEYQIEAKEKIFKALSEINLVSKNRKKREDVLSIISIGLGFFKIGAIGKKVNIRKYKKTNSIVVYDSTYFEFNDDNFNNPFINFKECLNEFNDFKKCGFSDIQKEKIQNILINIRDSLKNL